jgi:uncharacterized protein with NAD-binding domain and iron-sulfur cluster
MNGKSVVILGGGLAGMQAGVGSLHAVSGDGARERSATPGAKLKSWGDRRGPKDSDPAAVIPMPTWPMPYDRLRVVSAMADFGILSPDDRRNLITVVRKLGSYDYNDRRETEYLDRITMADFLKGLGCYTPGMKAYFNSFCELGYYANIENASALTLAKR